MNSYDDVKKNLEKRFTPPGELAPESTKLSTITSPVEDLGTNLLTNGQVKIDTAGASGLTSDTVLMGSPGAEYGAQGRFALDGMIKASEQIAKEKYAQNREADK